MEQKVLSSLPRLSLNKRAQMENWQFWLDDECGVFPHVVQCVSVLCSRTINLPQRVGTTARVKLNCHLVSSNVLVLLELVYSTCILWGKKSKP